MKFIIINFTESGFVRYYVVFPEFFWTKPEINAWQSYFTIAQWPVGMKPLCRQNTNMKRNDINDFYLCYLISDFWTILDLTYSSCSVNPCDFLAVAIPLKIIPLKYD
jgi:hypothetical protein